MRNKHVVINLRKLDSYSKDRTYVKDRKTYYYNFYPGRKTYSLSNYNKYISNIREIVEYDNKPNEALQ